MYIKGCVANKLEIFYFGICYVILEPRAFFEIFVFGIFYFKYFYNHVFFYLNIYQNLSLLGFILFFLVFFLGEYLLVIGYAIPFFRLWEKFWDIIFSPQYYIFLAQRDQALSALLSFKIKFIITRFCVC